MLENARLTAFTVSELLRENQLGVGLGKGLDKTTQPRSGLIYVLKTKIHLIISANLNFF